MSHATTLQRVVNVIGAVAGITGGVGVVHDRIRTGIDRTLSEGFYIGSAGVNSWEVNLDPEARHGGASGYQHLEADVEILAHYRADDSGDSRNAFAQLIGLVETALLDPANLPQITPAGVRLVERPSRPIRLATGQAAYRARLAFRLWDLANT